MMASTNEEQLRMAREYALAALECVQALNGDQYSLIQKQLEREFTSAATAVDTYMKGVTHGST